MSDDVSRVKEAISIVDLIGEFVDLKKAGKNYKGLCPFHKEKTPSFVVSEERGTYKCFGCGEYGDVFSFLMKRDNMTFPEALDYLADKGGIVLTNTRTNRKEKIDLEKYYKINEDARKFFYQNLLTNKKARDYLRKREIEAYTINEFSLGYAPDSWNSLLNFMLNQGHKVEDLLELGLIGKSSRGSYYDVYRDRLIFPIFNISNRIIAFGGRTLGDSKAKYINSQDSKVYHKGGQLYGLNIVHNGNDRERIILVEGYMDVIGLYQAGITNTIAALGTALTEEQAKLCSRYSKQVYLCYDSDSAGIKATLRAIEVFTSIKVFPKVIVLEDGMDPDDYVKKYGADAFERKIKEAVNYIEFQLDLLVQDVDISDPSVMAGLLEKIAGVINPIKSEVMRDEYIERTAGKLNINPLSLANDLGKFDFTSYNEIKKDNKFKDEKIEGNRSVPATLILALKFAINNRKYFEEFDKYLAYLSDYGMGAIYNYIKSVYDTNDVESIDLLLMKDYLNLNDRQVKLLSFNSISDEKIAYNELINRLKRFDLDKEKLELKNNISMMSSIVDNDPDKLVDLKKMLDRLTQIEKELKSNDGWRD